MKVINNDAVIEISTSANGDADISFDKATGMLSGSVDDGDDGGGYIELGREHTRLMYDEMKRFYENEAGE
jgi:hypothetical protein